MATLSINTNVQSMMAQNNLSKTTNALQENQERLSSGLRINSAADDPAGLAISDRFTAQIKGQDQAMRNSQDGISLIQTAEGGVSETTNILQSMREIAVQSANDTNTDSDRESLNQEFNQLREEMDRIANSTSFNGQNLLNGSFGSGSFQVGANAGNTNQLSVDLTQSMESGNIGSQANSDLVMQDQSVTNTGGQAGVSAGEIGGTLSAGELSVQGVNLDTTEIGAASVGDVGGGSNGEGASSAFAVAQAVNGSSELDVEANTRTTEVTANNTGGSAKEVTGTSNSNGSTEYTLAINGTTIVDKQNVADNTLTAEDAASQINNKAGDTNVTASVNDSGELQLAAEDGRSIKVQEIANGHATGGGVTAEADGFFNTINSGGGSAMSSGVGSTEEFRGAVELSADESISVTDNDPSSANEIDTFANTEFVSGGGNASATATPNQLNSVDVSTQENARAAIRNIDTAISDVDSFRGTLGASQNRFESTISNLETSNTALTESRSRIQDADIAQQAAEQTQNNIRRQAASSVLAQANQNQQIALQLLGGG